MTNLAVDSVSDIEINDDAILLVGSDETVSYANTAAHRLLGYQPGQLHGLSLKWLSPPSRHGELRNVAAVFSGQTARRIRSVALRADGKSMDVALSLEPCRDAQGNVVAVSLRYEPQLQHSMVVPRVPSRLSAPHISMLPSKPSRLPPPSPVSTAPVRSERTQKVRVPPHGPRSLPPPPPPTTKPTRGQETSSEELRDRLDSTIQLLGWLDARFASENDPSLDDTRERQKLRTVLDDAKDMVQECRRELDALLPAIPKAPKLPQMR